MAKSRFTQKEIKEFVLQYGEGFDDAKAAEWAADVVKEGHPIIETMCFQMLAEFLLASIHKTSWLTARAKNPDADFDGVIKRILDSGVSAKDLAFFARSMQKELLSNLGCLLDGSGIFPSPQLPCTDFRIFAIDDNEKPIAMIEDLHEELSPQDLRTEMRQSRKSAQLPTN